MSLDHTVHNGQSQATAISIARLPPIETLKDVRLVYGTDARAAVAYPQTHALPSLLGANLHLSTGWGELDRIVQQIADGRFDPGLVTAKGKFRDWLPDEKYDFFFLGQVLTPIPP